MTDAGSDPCGTAVGGGAPLEIGGEACSGEAGFSVGATECGGAPILAAPCPADGRGPRFVVDGWDACSEAAASPTGRAVLVARGDFALEATCERAVVTGGESGGLRATIFWGGSLTIAEVVANRGPVTGVDVEATIGETGCTAVARFHTMFTDAIVASLPPDGGTVGVGRMAVVGLSPSAGAERCGVAQAWCAEYEGEVGLTLPWGSALPACGTAGVNAPIGGCGDLVGVPFSMGAEPGSSRLELGFTWDNYETLCH